MLPFLQKLTYIVQDPPPDFAFELTESGIAFARPSSGGETSIGFEALEPDVLSLSPLGDNVLRADALAARIRAVSGAGAGRKRRRAVVILPDFAARVAVLTFDKFPSDAAEQLGLVRFRMKKSVPFDVESAAVSYQPMSGGKGRTEVVVVVAALEIVARYEAAVRAAGLHPGLVTTSAVAMSELVPSNGISVVARITGKYLSVVVMNGAALKLVRTVELPEVTDEEILGVLLPTLAYVEDELGAPATRIALCGFGQNGVVPGWTAELQVPVEPLRSRFGMPNGFNAGLLGYLESTTSGVKAA
jgi:type IV pilus assembly protein PilM